MSNNNSEALATFAKETLRFRSELAKGRSAIQLSLFDLLVERSADRRSPKEIEIALVLFGEQELKDAGADSGVRVYVHRLRKRLDEYYRDKAGPRLVIPKGEYRILLDNETLVYRKSFSPVLGIGLFVIAVAILLLASWAVTPSSREVPLASLNRQGTIIEKLFRVENPVIVVGDRLAIAETTNQSSVQRMILEPTVGSREDLGRYLKAHPDTFYRLYDFNLRFAPAASAGAAWQLQDGFGDKVLRRTESENMQPMSALSDSMLKTRDLVYVGRISNLGPLAKPVFMKSHFRLDAYNKLIDLDAQREYASNVQMESGENSLIDYGYLAVLGSPFGRNIVVLAGLDDPATRAMTDFATAPGNVASLRGQLKNSRQFEALFEVRSSEGLPVETRLISLRAIP